MISIDNYNMIEVRHLQLIQAISECGNMTRAATHLHLTQPSLSHQLKDIEMKLDTKLFLRVNKNLILTAAGERLLREANEILPRLASVAHDLQKEDESPRQLRISTKCYTCYHWLPELMKTFQKQFSGIEIDIITEAMTDPVDYLLKDKIDLAITSLKEKRNGIHYDKLFDDEQVLLVPRDHPLAKKEYVRLKDFENENLIIYKGTSSADSLDLQLAKAGITLKQTIKMQLTEARVELVKAGMGITAMSRWLVKPFIGDGSTVREIRIGKNGFHRTWYIATLTQKRNEAYITSFVQFLKARQLG